MATATPFLMAESAVSVHSLPPDTAWIGCVQLLPSQLHVTDPARADTGRIRGLV